MLAETAERPDAPENKTETLDYLMRRYGDKVLKLAYYHVRDRHLAEDILQEVFCRVYLNLEKFRRDSSYFTWIYRITVNLCHDYKVSAYYRRILPVAENTEEKRDSDARLFETVEGGEIFAKVMDLPEKYRAVIALYYFDEMTTPEIAQVLKITENTARARLFRGRNMLKEVLDKEGCL